MPLYLFDTNLDDDNWNKGSFTYYVITKGDWGGGGEFRKDYANVIFALSNAESDYGRGEGV